MEFHNLFLDNDRHEAARDLMVRQQIKARGITDSLVLGAMKTVPRHLFMPAEMRRYAYDDTPLAIGFGQTISQPYIVALMTELLHPRPSHRVLEIGTGSGYQTAILAEIVEQVYTIEIVPELQERTEKIFQQLGYANIHARLGDGYAGWPEEAPFDGVIVTAAPELVPQPLLYQLAADGRLVIPVGDYYQYLEIYAKTDGRFTVEQNVPVRFVRMTGRADKGVE